MMATPAGFCGRFGVARADITPPVGIYARNWGAGTHDAAEGIHRPLTATALAISELDSDRILLIMAVDLGWWRTEEDEQALRCPLLDQLGLDEDQLLVCLSHTHSGPSLCRADAGKPGGEHIAPYFAQLRQTLSEIGARAMANLEPGTMAASTGWCTLAQNRDMPAGDGKQILTGWCGEPHPPTPVTVLQVTTSTGTKATVVHYACHPTTLGPGNRLISPDYIGAMRELVELETGAPCLYLHGAAGNLAPALQYVSDTEVADSHGRTLGYAVLSALSARPGANSELCLGGIVESGAKLAVWKEETAEFPAELRGCMFHAPMPVKADLPTLAEIDSALERESDRALAERLLRRRRISGILEGRTVYPMPFWAWRIGSLEIVAQPNELYPPQADPGKMRLYVNCANGPYLGYLPTSEAYEFDNYPVWQTPLDRGCFETFLECAEEALLRLG